MTHGARRASPDPSSSPPRISDTFAAMFRVTLRLSDGYPEISPDRRDDVKAMQRDLVRWGFPIAPDGKFGPSTEAAVRSFQKRRGLKDDGVVGARTWDALAVPDARPIGAGFHPELSTDGAKTADGSGKNATLSAVDAGSNSGVVLAVPWYSQFDSVHVERSGNTACFRACRAMARAVGVLVPVGTARAIQVATGEDGAGRVLTDGARTQAARDYIDSELEKRHPVAVGVSHQVGNYNADHITDHYVLVFGRVLESGHAIYLYNDPATRHEATGRGGRFRVDAGNGNLVHDGALAQGYVVARHTEMSMVVRNTE
jgi:peptidoglycan hydrolase-like protein with peptidoglycan-binding domain